MSYTCPRCGAVSHNPNDERERYCGRCKTFEVPEFDCVECGRHIIAFGPRPKLHLCGACMMMPGWFRDAKVRAIIDPEHDGRERVP